jgi:hypothetical protein
MARITPWNDSQEWMEIYKKLYSTVEEDQWVGVKRVKAWCSRGRIPQSVEATATFVEIGLRRLYPKESALLLSMALIRFVNGVVDSAQRGNVAVSAVGIAEQMELPLWLVELRHEATHGKIPPLNQLQKARLQAIDWLETYYWKVQATAVQDTTELISTFLKEYKEQRKDFMSKKDASFQKLQKVLTGITSTLTADNYADILLPFIFEVGYLVSSSVKNQVDFNTEFLDEDYIILVWEPLLTCCEVNWSGFSGVFLNAVLDGYSKSPNHAVKLYWPTLSTWCKYLLKSFMIPWNSYDQKAIIKTLLANSNTLTLDLLAYLDHLNEIPDVLKPFYDFVLARHDLGVDDLAMDIEFEWDGDTMNGELFSAIHKEQENSIEEEKQVLGWELISNWQKCPIGVLPGFASVGNLDLPIEYDDADYAKEQGIVSMSTNLRHDSTQPRFIPNVVLF